MKNIFNNAINGDGTEVLLPQTRMQSFAFYGKQQFWKLLLVGIVTSLFFIPSLVWLFVMNYLKTQALGALDVNSITYTTQYSSTLLSYCLTTYLVLIPLIALFFVGLSGLCSLVKRICFYETSNYSRYFVGIKQNWLHFMLWGIVVGISLFFLCFNVSYYAVITINSTVKALLTGFAIVQFALVSIATMYFVTGDVTYKYTFCQAVRNAFLLAFTSFFKNLLVVVVALLPLILTLLIPSPFQLLALTALGLFYIGFLALFWNCYCQGVYDKYINNKLGDEFVRRGLYKEKSTENE